MHFSSFISRQCLNHSVAVSLVTTTLVASFMPYTASHADSQFSAKAVAQISGCTDGGIKGFATLSERASDEGVKEIDVFMLVEGLSSGKHAVHIHETAECVPCGSAKGHFDPGNFGMTNPDANHPYHSGDLINIDSNDGAGVMTTRTSRVTLSKGPLSLFDEDGSAFIVHDLKDSYCPEGEAAGCAGGSRAACGVITPIDTASDFNLMVSTSSYRRDAVELANAELTRDAYVFISPIFPKQHVENVLFFLDGKRFQREYYAPYDLNGTSRNRQGAPLWTGHLRDGTHNVSAVITYVSGERTFVAAEFTVDNDNRRFGNGSQKH